MSYTYCIDNLESCQVLEDQKGLSSLHIRSPKVIPAVARIYKDGSLATVTRELVEKKCLECGDRFRVAAFREASVHTCDKCRGVQRGGMRGEVSVFSPASRKRLMCLLNKLRKDVRPHFATLTYSDAYEYYNEPERWKRDLRAFEHRLRRRFPGGSFIWRLEVVDRKSGDHVGEFFPHFHLLVFGVPFAELREFVPQAWFEVVGTGDPDHLAAGTQVAKIRTRRGLMNYASKTVGKVMGAELGKAVQAMGGSVGRWWGVAMRKKFVQWLSEYIEVRLADLESVRLIRYFRRKIKAFGRDYRSLTAFWCGDDLSTNLPRMVIPVGDRSYSATGRKITGEKFWQWAYRTGRLKATW